MTTDSASDTTADVRTLTESDSQQVKRALRDLIALERDRCLGYPYEDLHIPAEDAIEHGLAALSTLDGDPDVVVLPEDQERLDLDWERLATDT